jgi:hypothetical protein
VLGRKFIIHSRLLYSKAICNFHKIIRCSEYVQWTSGIFLWCRRKETRHMIQVPEASWGLYSQSMCHSSGSYLPDSHCGGPGSNPGLVLWDLWWTKWRCWSGFSPGTSVSLFSFHRLLHTHHHLSSGAGTIGQTATDVPSRLSLTPPPRN